MVKKPREYLDPNGTYCFFDVRVGNPKDNGMEGRLIIHLRTDVAPKTCENFRVLCTGDEAQKGKQPVSYLGSIFHRVIPGFMAQAGDYETGDGRGGQCAWGGKMKDENFILPHEGRGVLSMANAGPNTSGSQFFLLFKEAPHLDGKHTVFGKLVAGWNVLECIEKQPTAPLNNKPNKDIVILRCGQLKLDKMKDVKKQNDLHRNIMSGLDDGDAEAERVETKLKIEKMEVDSDKSAGSDSDSSSDSSSAKKKKKKKKAKKKKEKKDKKSKKAKKRKKDKKKK